MLQLVIATLLGSAVAQTTDYAFWKAKKSRSDISLEAVDQTLVDAVTSVEVYLREQTVTAKLIKNNRRCKNYKIGGKWTRTFLSGNNRPGSVQACAKRCVEDSAAIGATCNMLSYGHTREHGNCLFTAGARGCELEAGYHGYGFKAYVPVVAWGDLALFENVTKSKFTGAFTYPIKPQWLEPVKIVTTFEKDGVKTTITDEFRSGVSSPQYALPVNAEREQHRIAVAEEEPAVEARQPDAEPEPVDPCDVEGLFQSFPNTPRQCSWEKGCGEAKCTYGGEKYHLYKLKSIDN